MLTLGPSSYVVASSSCVDDKRDARRALDLFAEVEDDLATIYPYSTQYLLNSLKIHTLCVQTTNDIYIWFKRGFV